MKIVGVSIKESNPPNRADLVKMALNTKEFARVKNAERLINKEIDKSGIYRYNSKSGEVTKKQDNNSDREVTKKKSAKNTSEDKK